jgi:hypothetical protein
VVVLKPIQLAFGVIRALGSGLSRVDLIQRSHLSCESALHRLSEGIEDGDPQVISVNDMSSSVQVAGSVNRNGIYLYVRRIGGPKNSWRQTFTGGLVPVDDDQSELRGTIGVAESVSLFSVVFLAFFACLFVIGIIGLVASLIFFSWTPARPFMFISIISIAALGLMSGLVTLAPRASLWEREYLEEWTRRLLADS